jgi:hypothetical protein
MAKKETKKQSGFFMLERKFITEYFGCLSSNAISLYIYLAQKVNVPKNGDKAAYPSYDTIKKETPLKSNPTISKTIDELLAYGLITDIQKKYPNSLTSPNAYFMNMDFVGDQVNDQLIDHRKKISQKRSEIAKKVKAENSDAVKKLNNGELNNFTTVSKEIELTEVKELNNRCKEIELTAVQNLNANNTNTNKTKENNTNNKETKEKENKINNTNGASPEEPPTDSDFFVEDEQQDIESTNDDWDWGEPAPKEKEPVEDIPESLRIIRKTFPEVEETEEQIAAKEKDSDLTRRQAMFELTVENNKKNKVYYDVNMAPQTLLQYEFLKQFGEKEFRNEHIQQTFIRLETEKTEEEIESVLACLNSHRCHPDLFANEIEYWCKELGQEPL